MNLLWIPVIAFFSALLGFMIKNGQLAKTKSKVISLENEMLKNHAEILSLQKELALLQSAAADSRTPVVKIKENVAEEKSSIKKQG